MQHFLDIIRADPGLTGMLEAMQSFNAPDPWLVSGALFQTVWNVLEGNSRGHGIDDYDLFYFDPDTSVEAEDAWIKKAARHFAFADHEVQLRNQARVHLWYPQKFDLPYPELKSSCQGVDQFLVQASVVAIRQSSPAALDIYAPLGLDDIFNRILRPNPLWKGQPRKEYKVKCDRYLRNWPSLRFKQ
ncbi:MAG: nucleotidyltransferase family protein [Micropepsaceae bacterium]